MVEAPICFSTRIFIASLFSFSFAIFQQGNDTHRAIAPRFSSGVWPHPPATRRRRCQNVSSPTGWPLRNGSVKVLAKEGHLAIAAPPLSRAPTTAHKEFDGIDGKESKAESMTDSSGASRYGGRIGEINQRFRLVGAKPNEKQEALMTAAVGRHPGHPRQSTNTVSKKRFSETMPESLLPDAQLTDDVQVPLRFMMADIIQQPSSTTHHLQQTTTACIVLRIGTHVFRQIVDPLGEQRNLHLRRPIVSIMGRILLHEFTFPLVAHYHDRPTTFCSKHFFYLLHGSHCKHSRLPGNGKNQKACSLGSILSGGALVLRTEVS
jgi:hypothetical protein